MYLWLFMADLLHGFETERHRFTPVSGPALDQMKGDRRLLTRMTWEEINEELDIQSALLDAIASRWTAGQAQAALLQFEPGGLDIISTPFKF